MRKILFFHAAWCNPCKFLQQHIINPMKRACPVPFSRRAGTKREKARHTWFVDKIVVMKNGQVLKAYERQ